MDSVTHCVSDSVCAAMVPALSGIDSVNRRVHGSAPDAVLSGRDSVSRRGLVSALVPRLERMTEAKNMHPLASVLVAPPGNQ